MFDDFLGPLLRAPQFFYLTVTSPYTLGSLLILAFVLAVEPVFCGWQKSSLHRLLVQRPSARIDCIWFVISMIGLGTAAAFPILFLVSKVISVKPAFQFLPSTWTGINSRALDYLIYILVFDLVGYCVHTLQHKVPLLWSFHKVHHSATEFTAISSARQHFVEGIFVLVAYSVVAGFIGASPQEVTLIWGARVALTYCIHSNIQTSFGWLGKWLLVSPNAHRIHHSAAPEHFDSNFGGTFIIWDRLFGTYRTADPAKVTLGLGPGMELDRSFTASLLSPFRGTS